MAEINIRTDELLPARDASRALGKAIAQLVSGTAEKYVIVNRNKVQAVLLSVDRYAELANGLESDVETRRAA
jgi:PHD/YefM family antitoxin component YafN of YafNO toxin-antitoxin module